MLASVELVSVEGSDLGLVEMDSVGEVWKAYLPGRRYQRRRGPSRMPPCQPQTFPTALISCALRKLRLSGPVVAILRIGRPAVDREKVGEKGVDLAKVQRCREQEWGGRALLVADIPVRSGIRP